MQINPFFPTVESIIVDIESTAISAQDAGWYYASIDISNRIPDGFKAIGIESYTGWQGNVFFNLHENSSGVTYVIIRSNSSATVASANRKIKVYLARCI